MSVKSGALLTNDAIFYVDREEEIKQEKMGKCCFLTAAAQQSLPKAFFQEHSHPKPQN